MSRRRSLAAVLGLTVLLGFGAAGAQKPDPDEPVSPRKALRERLIRLRTEVELLDLEHKADREDLLQSMRAVRKLERKGLDPETGEEIGKPPGQVEVLKQTLSQKDFEEKVRKTRLRATKLHDSIERKKLAFSHQTEELNRRKLDLEEVENRYKAMH